MSGNRMNSDDLELSRMKELDPSLYMNYLESKIQMFEAENTHLKSIIEVTQKSKTAKLAEEEEIISDLENKVSEYVTSIKKLEDDNNTLRADSREYKSVVNDLNSFTHGLVSDLTRDMRELTTLYHVTHRTNISPSISILLNKLETRLTGQEMGSPCFDNVQTSFSPMDGSIFSSYSNNTNNATSQDSSFDKLVEELGSVMLIPYQDALKEAGISTQSSLKNVYNVGHDRSLVNVVNLMNSMSIDEDIISCDHDDETYSTDDDDEKSSKSSQSSTLVFDSSLCLERDTPMNGVVKIADIKVDNNLKPKVSIVPIKTNPLDIIDIKHEQTIYNDKLKEDLEKKIEFERRFLELYSEKAYSTFLKEEQNNAKEFNDHLNGVKKYIGQDRTDDDTVSLMKYMYKTKRQCEFEYEANENLKKGLINVLNNPNSTDIMKESAVFSLTRQLTLFTNQREDSTDDLLNLDIAYTESNFNSTGFTKEELSKINEVEMKRQQRLKNAALMEARQGSITARVPPVIHIHNELSDSSFPPMRFVSQLFDHSISYAKNVYNNF